LTIPDSILQEMPSSGGKSAVKPTNQKNVDVAEMRAETLGNEKIFQEDLAQEIEDGVDSLDDSYWRSGRKNTRINYRDLDAGTSRKGKQRTSTGKIP